MIWNFVFDVLTNIVNGIFSFMPVVTIADIPYIGQSLSDGLTLAVGIWNSFLDTFPYAIIVWQVFVFVILPFEFIMLIVKVFLGHRAPAHLN